MSDFFQAFNPRQRRNCSARPARSIGALRVGILLSVLGGAFVLWKMTRPPGAEDTQLSTAAKPDQEAVTEPDRTLAASIGSKETSVTVVQPEQKDSSPRQSEANEDSSEDLPLPQPEELLAQILNTDLNHGLSRQEATELGRAIKAMGEHGAGALPVIQQFLEHNQDLNFQSVEGGASVGYPSLRLGLMEAVQQIGGPEAVALSSKTLQGTTDPAEVAILAHNLEVLAPGQYREESIQATRQSLEQAAKDQASRHDVAPLFHVAETFGDAKLLEDLATRYPQWSYYSTMALAGLPEGQGMPSLIREVQDPAVAGSGNLGVALQILAQVSAQYPEAASTLIEQARANKIPSQTWENIASGLGGDQYQYGSPLLDKNIPPEVETSLATYQVHSNQNLYVHTPSSEIPGLRTYHVEDSNQNFYSVPATAILSGDEIARRLETIEALIQANPGTAAIAALQRARSTLQSKSSP
jgi:hypothetical protein